MATKRQSLGKGLDALLGLSEENTPADQTVKPLDLGAVDGAMQQIPVELLQRGKSVSYTHLTLPTILLV